MVFWRGFCEKWVFFDGFLWMQRGECVVETWFLDGGKSGTKYTPTFFIFFLLLVQGAASDGLPCISQILGGANSGFLHSAAHKDVSGFGRNDVRLVGDMGWQCGGERATAAATADPLRG